MLARIATLTLTLAVIAACDRQQPQEPPRTPPPVGEAADTGYPTHAPDAPGMQARQPVEDPVGEGQHYEEGTYRSAFGERGTAMTDEQRDAALRECQRLQGEYRERCEQEVHERSTLDPMQRE